MKGHPIDKDFNTKPYQAFRRTSRIVHLHGPKPNHYLDWLLTGKCEFGNMCEQGFAYALCDYAMEYDQVGGWLSLSKLFLYLQSLVGLTTVSELQGNYVCPAVEPQVGGGDHASPIVRTRQEVTDARQRYGRNIMITAAQHIMSCYVLLINTSLPIVNSSFVDHMCMYT